MVILHLSAIPPKGTETAMVLCQIQIQQTKSLPLWMRKPIDKGRITQNQKDMANLFSRIFFNDYIPHTIDPLSQNLLQTALDSSSTDPVNFPISIEELNQAMKNTKSRTTGTDKIHNKTIINLLIQNKTALLSVFIIFLANRYVYSDWKVAIIVQILKTNNQKENPASYRRVALASCLSKLMERIITTRLS